MGIEITVLRRPGGTAGRTVEEKLGNTSRKARIQISRVSDASTPGGLCKVLSITTGGASSSKTATCHTLYTRPCAAGGSSHANPGNRTYFYV